ncbi:hypothetical protein OAH81_03670 [Candidatus Pseudothioglobus singularis]|nr:hypothetical protein [Candidatus Pseudothioglobus singularis]MDB4822118.1 hypothetical protein [Candidatus Pseudothioglobus singularis]
MFQDVMFLKNKVHNNGYLYLFIWLFLVLIFNYLLGNMHPKIVPDTESYLYLSDLETSLGVARTPFYGMIVLLFENIFPNYIFMPWLNFLMLGISTILLFKNTRYFGLSKVASYAISIPFSLSNIAILFMGYVHPEIISISFVLIALSGAFVLAKFPRNLLWLILTPLFLSFAYLLKPGFILFIFILPIFIFLLALLSDIKNLRLFLNKILVLFILSIIPFMTYSTIRLVLVDDFHIVSFAGVNGSGLSGQLIDQDTLLKLDIENKIIANRILEDRLPMEEAGIILPVPINSSNGEKIIWSSLVGYFDIHARNYDHISKLVHSNINNDESWVSFNKRIANFNRAVIQVELKRYISYIVGASTRFFGLLLVTNILFILSLCILGILCMTNINLLQKHIYKDSKIFTFEIIIIFLLISLYILANYIPSIFLAFPARRYVDTAGVFLGSIPLYLIFSIISLKKSLK